MKDKILAKMFSGRYFLTVVAGVVFGYAVKVKLLDSQATAAIITMVFINYFQRDRKPENGDGK